MLKTVASASITGQLSYQGTWNASTNSPTLTSSVGTLNQYYVVSVAGTTTLNGISQWAVGDWVIFNGSVWERVEGSSSEIFTTLTVTGTGNITNLVSGNVTLTGGTENAITYSNVTINSGTATLTSISLPYNGSSSSTGPIAVGGNMSGGPDTGLVGTFIGSANSYTYMFQQNTNTGTGAYSTYTIATNDYSAYANFGINNNNFVGSPNNAFNSAKNAYWYSHGGDAVFGSYTNNAVHFIANGGSSTSDAMTINANNTVTINALNQSTNANATMSTASIPLVPLGYIIINNNGTNVKIPYYAV